MKKDKFGGKLFKKLNTAEFIYSIDDQLAGFKDTQIGLFQQGVSLF